MKIFIVALLISVNCFAQRYTTEVGVTNFEASVPTLIPVKAENAKTKVIFETSQNAIAILMYISEFEFRIPLMQEHFNENYMQTGEYPKATFQGVIADNKVSGTLTIKGVAKEIEAPITFIKDDTISISGAFKVRTEEFEIEVPKIVSRKMAEEISISFNYSLFLKD